MEIRLYEEWMRPQVLTLFSNEYGRTESELKEVHANFYDHEFQKKRCIRIAALDGSQVVGFQTLFYWPYVKNNKVYRSLQSGNSIVHPSYRGKGMFQKLLQYLDDHQQELQIDFLMGFPVEASYRSFIKNTWKNPFDLIWYLKVVNPAGFLFSKNRLAKMFDKQPALFMVSRTDDIFRLQVDETFHSWRIGFSNPENHFYYNYKLSGEQLTFGLKFFKRNKYFNELIIGELRSTTYDPEFLHKAMRSLVQKARQSLCVSALTVALVENSGTGFLRVVKKNGFIKTKKKIYFITKTYDKVIDVNDPEKWELYRGDIDSW